MSALAIFGICVAIIIALLMVAVAILGSGSVILIAILPVVITEAITGVRGTFSPNGSGSSKSPVFQGLVIFFLVLQVLVVAGFLFGLYCLIFGWPASASVVAEPAATLSVLQIYRLQLINTVLWLMSGFFIVMICFNLIRYREHWQKTKKITFFSGYILPIAGYLLSFIFLGASRNYLEQYPQGSSHLNLFVKALTVVYVGYLIFTTGQVVYLYRTILRGQLSQLKFQYWFGMATGLFYKILFIYFVVCIFGSL
jgi:hypothetical protein